MRDEQLSHAGQTGGGAGVLRRQMHLFAFAMPVDVGLAEEQVGAPGEMEQSVARPAVPGVREHPPAAFGAQPVGLDVVLDGVGGEGQVAVPGGVTVVEGLEVEDSVEEPGIRPPEESGETPPLLNAWEVPPARSRRGRRPEWERPG